MGLTISGKRNFHDHKDYAEKELGVGTEFVENANLIDRSIYRNEVYSLIENISTGERKIIIHLLSKDDGYWCHRSYDETMFPDHLFNCADRILKESNCTHPDAVQWREFCRTTKLNKKNLKKLFKEMESGVPITTVNNKNLIYVSPYNESCTQVLCRTEAGGLYRYKVNFFDYKMVHKQYSDYKSQLTT